MGGLFDYTALQEQGKYYNTCSWFVIKEAALKDRFAKAEKIKKAIELTEYVFERYILLQVKPGIGERELARQITYWGQQCGAQEDAFAVIVASGCRSSEIHGYASEKKLELGDIVQFDFGYILDGYCSDFSRVVVLGEPTEEQKKIYNIVLTAQKIAIEKAKPRMRCRTLDRIARNYIKESGYGDYFIHGLGHGLGELVHEPPGIHPESKECLRSGDVVTIEPGIYIPKWGGIRLEDVVVITKGGCRNLTTFPRDLIIVK